jgi:periplasmic protein CpxP/Spy
MRNKTLPFLALLACSLTATPSFAGKDRHDCPDKQRHGHHMKHFTPHKMIKRLDLSEEQQQQFKAIHEENKTQYRAHHQALRENRRQLHELIASGGYTEDQASQLADRHGAITAELARLRASETVRLYALLTPEQREKFSSFKFEDDKGAQDKSKKKSG